MLDKGIIIIEDDFSLVYLDDDLAKTGYDKLHLHKSHIINHENLAYHRKINGYG